MGDQRLVVPSVDTKEPGSNEQPMKTETLVWWLFWSTLFVVLFVGQYTITQNRLEEQHHTAVMESVVPPSTSNISTQ